MDSGLVVLTSSFVEIDLERTSCHGAKAGIRIRLSLVVTHPRERKCGEAVEANNRSRVGARTDLRLLKYRPQPYPTPIRKTRYALLPASWKRRTSGRTRPLRSCRSSIHRPAISRRYSRR